MELHTPRHSETTVGRVEIPDVPYSSVRHRSLAGTLTGAQVPAANSARRRLYGPTLLQSPPRRGHGSKMEDIFNNAKASMSAPALRIMSPVPVIRKPPLHIRPAGAMNQERQATDTTDASGEGTVIYTTLTQADSLPVPKPGTSDLSSIPGRENGKQRYQTTRFYARLQEEFAQNPIPRLSPAPGTPQNSFFNCPPKIAHAQIVTMNEIETARTQEDLSSSSASWTGDSQFYAPQQRTLDLPCLERKSSIPEWLAKLPVELEDFEQYHDSDDDEVVQLSPAVQIERGSMRRKMQTKERCKRRESHCNDAEEDVGSTVHDQE